MPYLPSPFRPHGRPSAQEREQAADQRRGSARERGYTRPWDKAAKAHLDRYPLCVYCAMDAWGDGERDEAATLVDHLIPHRGDQAVFWNKADWISSCATCHNGPKQQAERRLAPLQVLANAVRAFLASPAGRAYGRPPAGGPGGGGGRKSGAAEPGTGGHPQRKFS